MSDLTEKEQTHVRTALLFLRVRCGGWAPLAKALRFQAETLGKVASGRRGVNARMALLVARFIDVPFDDLIAGKYLSSRTCPYCGHPPKDFADEDTRVDAGPDGLKLVK